MNSNIALVDDHILIRKGLGSLIRTFDSFKVLFEADNGKEFISKLDSAELPDVVLMDINMPEMDGYETSLWLKKNHPSVRVLALSMYDNEIAIIRMFKAGARGYLLKDCNPADLRDALYSIVSRGFYYSELVTGRLIHNIKKDDDDDNPVKDIIQLNDRELTFLKLVCSELTYKEIADKMCLSPRTIDGYRDDLFKRLDLKTRVGLVMYAIKNGIITL